MSTMTDTEIIAWARMLGDTWHQLFGDDSKAAYRFRRLADLAEKGAEDWQPIVTAPGNYDTVELVVRGFHNGVDWVEAGTNRVIRPTHWRPLPAPPGGER